MGPYHVLIVDPKPNSCRVEHCERLPKLIKSLFPSGRVILETATRFPSERNLFRPDLVVIRPSLAEPRTEVLAAVRKRWNGSPILGLFCAGWEGSTEIVHSFLDELDDFLSCPFKEIEFFSRIRRLLRWRDGSCSQASAVKAKFHLESLVGENGNFLREIEKIPPLAQSEAPVLLLGETGTGKELFSRAIHYLSSRKAKPFIPLNCGALPDHLFENELFGHVKGAFTDASSAEKGLIAEAEGGTLLFDEIDTLSPSAQIKLLRFLQDQEYRPLGSSKSIVANVRVVAATNTDLGERMQKKLFREDLYYRLNVLSLSIPPLRERIEDIPILAAYFLNRYGSRYHRSLHFSPGAMQKLIIYRWPGNVRELEGVIHRAVILTSSATLQPGDIDLPLALGQKIVEAPSLHEAKSLAVGQFERTYLTKLLAAHDGNVTRAAKAAGKERRTFQRLLRKYALERRAFQNPS